MAETQIPHGYKQTEVGVIPEDWEVIDLSRLCTLQRGFDITEATRVTGTVPVYSSSGLAYYHNKVMVFPPGVVTGRKGILGKVLLINEPFWPHDTTLWVKDFKGNHPAYVALVLQSFHLERLDAATSVPTLNRNNLAGHPIALPPTKAEQEAIAEVLSDADALIESLEQLITKKRQIKQGAMQELLTGKKRLPGFTTNLGYKQTEVGVIPQHWEVKTLGSFCEIVAGRDLVKKDFSPTFDQRHESPIYSNALTNKGLYGYSKTYQFEPDKITVTARGDIGTAVYRSTRFCAIGRLLVLSSKEPCDLRFVAEYINNSVDFALESTGVPQLTAPQISKYAVTLPPTKAEQEAIATILSDMETEIAALEEKLAKACQVKQGMMQELLTGKTRLIENGKWKMKNSLG